MSSSEESASAGSSWCSCWRREYYEYYALLLTIVYSTAIFGLYSIGNETAALGWLAATLITALWYAILRGRRLQKPIPRTIMMMAAAAVAILCGGTSIAAFIIAYTNGQSLNAESLWLTGISFAAATKNAIAMFVTSARFPNSQTEAETGFALLHE